MSWQVFQALLGLSLVAGAGGFEDVGRSGRIDVFLEEVVVKEDIPGVIAAISSSEGVNTIGSAGVRKVGSKVEILVDDVVHLGSCTKAMTSALMGILVEEKLLTWETKLISVFPELNEKIHRDFHEVTVWDLLTHRSGVPANALNWRGYQTMPLRERRLAILEANLKGKPVVERGTYLYSNLGYMVAGCMAEKVTGFSWEALIRKRLFGPLKMDSAGFGAPGSPLRIAQPWGHFRFAGKWRAMHLDNAEALGPAGRVHCTVRDWARFLALQLPSEGSRKAVLNPQLLKKLVTPSGEYGGGWVVVEREWGKGLVLTHTGSNTIWFATVWVAPLLDRAYIVVTNSCDERSAGVCDRVIQKLIAIDGGK